MKGLAWLWFGIAGAAFAGCVNVLSKTALTDKKADVYVALCLQSLLMLTTLLAATTIMGRWGHLGEMPRNAVLLIVASGVAGGLAWTFGYKSLQLTDVAKATQVAQLSTVVALFLAVLLLKERPSALNWTGVALILAGSVCVSWATAKK